MAGAERQRRFDLDAELVDRNARAVVVAMHDEAPCAHGYQFLERGLDPVLGLDSVERNVPRHVIAGGKTYEFADRGLFGWFGEMHGDAPAPVRALKRRDRGLALEKALGQEIDHALGGLFAADGEAGAAGTGSDGRGHEWSG